MIEFTTNGLVPHDEVCKCKVDRVIDTPMGNQVHFDSYDISWHREYMNPELTMAVGFNDDGTVDEVLTRDGEGIHIECMDDDHIWMLVHNTYTFAFQYRIRKDRLHSSKGAGIDLLYVGANQ